MRRRLLSIVTVLALCLTLLPVTASAAGETGTFTVEGGTLGTDYDYDSTSGVLTIQDGANVTISMAEGVTQTTTDRIEVAKDASATVTLAGVNIDVHAVNDSAAFKVADDSAGDVTVTLAEGTQNTLKSGDNCAGLQKNGTAGSLTIDGAGSLTASSDYYGAGVGGGNGASSTVTITGGTINATGGYYGAGIGSGRNGASTVTISGGTVNATGGSSGAGIGCGAEASTSTVTITGGTVNATGGYEEPGIGGYDPSAAAVIISGGAVTAIPNAGESFNGNGSGISGSFSTGDNGSATVTAYGFGGDPGITDVSGIAQWQGLFWNNHQWQVCGNYTLTSPVQIYSGGVIAVMNNAHLTIAEGGELKCGGTLAIDATSDITLAGGTFTETEYSKFAVCPLTEDRIVLPDGVTYDGTDKTEVLKSGTTIDDSGVTPMTVLEKTFTPDYSAWAQSVTKDDELHYTVTYSLGCMRVSKELALEKIKQFAVSGGTEGTDYDYVDDVLTIKTAEPITVSMAAGANISTIDRIEVAKDVDANVTLNGVNIDVSATAGAAAFQVADNSTGSVTVTLVGENTLKSGVGCAGMQKNGAVGSLTIDGEGSLTAQGSEASMKAAAGIGGGYGKGTNVIIRGGTINATGGISGIGLGYLNSRGSVTITGGNITATGTASEGSGVGGGYAEVTISGGTVNAKGGSRAAAIGGGPSSDATVTMTAGTVTAQGGSGIGSGSSGSGTVTISGGAVTAVGTQLPGIQGSFSTGETGSAIVFASSTKSGRTGFSDMSGQSAWKGLIFDGSDGQVGGSFTLNSDFTIGADQTLAVMNGATLTLADGVTLTNSGALAIERAESITGPGTLAGDGKYAICPLTEDMVNAPTDLAYDGTDKTETIRGLTTINHAGVSPVTVLEKNFTPDYSVWRQTITKDSETRYTVSYALGGVTVSKYVNVERHDHLIVEGGTLGTDYTYENTVVTVLTDTPLTFKNNDAYLPETGAGTDRIQVTDGVNANITLAGVDIDMSATDGAAAFKVADDSKGSVTVTLAEGTRNTLKSGKDCAGLQKNGYSGTLTISGSGSLTAVGASSGGGAGIGSGLKGACKGLTIDGGVITATGGGEGAGIGSGGYSPTAAVTINGGTVKATGGNGAGIGGGEGGDGTVTINGGNVEAVGGTSGAGIGSAGQSASYCGTVTITGGTVKATGGQLGAGIGGGSHSRSDVTISGGAVTAIGGGEGCPGIGNGAYFSDPSPYYQPAFSTGENGTAQIIATSITDKSKQGQWKGLIFDGETWFVGGESVSMSADLTVEAGQTLTVAQGATLIIPEGMTLTNHGTLIVWDAASISCLGALTGDGAYKSCKLTPEMISVPQLTYEGTDLSETIQAQATLSDGEDVTISGKAFAFARELWTLSVTQQDKTEYTVTYTYSGMTVSKPVHTQKANELEVTGGTAGTDYTYENGVLTVQTTTPLTIRNKPTAATTTDRIFVAAGVDADITLAGVTIDVSKIDNAAAFEIEKDSAANVTVTLAKGTANTLKSGKNCAGLQKSSSRIMDENDSLLTQGPGALTIEGPGALSAEGGSDGAGIGGGHEACGCNIIINGGQITASGGFWAAAIGGGYNGVGIVTINGGHIDATHVGGNAAGIGGGFCRGTSQVTITGGTVLAKGSDDAAGIGGGCYGHGEITISGGLVMSTGGKGDARSIGSGKDRYNSQISCTGNAIIYCIPPEDTSNSLCKAMDDYGDRADWACVIFGCTGSGSSGRYVDRGRVYGAVTLPQDLEITADGLSRRLDIPAGASLTVPAGKTLTNSGVLHITYGGALDCAGTLDGAGTFETENLTADMIAAPAGIAANGLDRSGEITAALTAPTATIGGQTFTVVGWTLDSVAPAEGSVMDYVVTYTNDADPTKTVSQTITLPKSAAQFVEDGAAKTLNGATETSAFTYGDTVTVKAKPTPTGEAPAALFSLTAPTANQMALYLGGAQVSQPADGDVDGTYTMTVSVKDLVAAGATYGAPVTLAAKFVENDIMVDGEATVAVTLSKKALTPSPAGSLTKVYDGTGDFTVPAENIVLGGLVEGDDVTATAAATLDSVNAGDQTFTGAAITLSGADADNYALSPETLSGTVTVTQKPLTVTAKAQTIPYGADIRTDLDQVTCEGLVPADELTGITLAKTATAVGTHQGDITVESAAITQNGADAAANYAITYVSGTLTIEKATPTVTAWPTAGAITYGQTLNDSTLENGAANVAGTFAWKDGTVQPAVADSGKTQYPVIFTPTDAASYNTVVGALTLTVNKSQPTVAFNGYPTVATYSGAPLADPTAEQMTVTGAAFDDVTFTWSAQPVNAGTYTLTASIGETANTAAASATQEVTIDPKALGADAITLEQDSYTYTGAPITPAVTVQDGSTILAENTDYTVTYGSNTAVGTATVTVTDIPGGNYTVNGEKTFQITKATPVVTPPEAKELHYTGEEQELVTAGSTTGGKLQYKLGDGTYSAAIPKALHIGDYTVYYKVVGGSNYHDVPEQSLSVKIDKTAPTYQAPTAVDGLVYDGTAKALVENGSATGGTLLYAAVAKDAPAPQDDAYSADIPTATNAGAYTVYYKVIGDADHGNIAPRTVPVTIAKAAPTVTTPTANALHYTGEAQALVTPGSATGGTLYYSLDGETWSETVPSGTNAGEYTVHYKVTGDSNHTDTEPLPVSVTIQHGIVWTADGALTVASPQTGTCCVIFAAYKDGALTSIKAVNVTFPEAGIKHIQPPETFETGAADTVKAFFWTTLSDMHPLCPGAVKPLK